mgnify:CR=1 FL=1
MLLFVELIVFSCSVVMPQSGAELPAEIIERVEFELLLHHCLSGQLFHMPESDHAVRRPVALFALPAALH